VNKKPKIALLCSEPIKPAMGGIGIRYLEMARHLPTQDLDVVLIHPGDKEAAASFNLDTAAVRIFQAGKLQRLMSGCACVVAQGQLANHLPLEVPEMPAAIDLYDPWLIENLNYYDTLGLGPFRNDLRSWIVQFSHGDFFLCSSEEQRLFYVGFLAALGRVNPKILKEDPDLTRLIVPVPFGVPDELPPYKTYLPERKPGEKRLLFGGVYDWYDPWTLLDALDRFAAEDWTLFFMETANPESTPQEKYNQLKIRAGKNPARIRFMERVPAERRFDLLRDVDILVAPHKINIETHLSLRTRFVEALAAGLPVICTESGSLSQLIQEHQAGWVVPPRDAGAILHALEEIFGDKDSVASRTANASQLAERFRWKEVLDPLLRFCLHPRRDLTKEEFAAPLDLGGSVEAVPGFFRKIKNFRARRKS
jgi:glycosyltransferase involved in cell wall biosynthesis